MDTTCRAGLLLLAALAGGCGTSDLEARSGSQTLVIEGDGALDGFVRTDGYVDRSGGGPGVGDLDNAQNGLSFRMFYSFPLDEIPEEAVITSVTLRVFQQGFQGDPFGNLGEVLVDHVVFGSRLDASDYAGGTLRSNVGALASTPLRVYMNLGVDAEVQADREAGRRRSQFRLRFPVDSNRDGGNDVVLLNDGENSRGIGNPPLLEVVYLRP